MSFLSELVVSKIREMGAEPAAEFFGVRPALVKQWEKGSKPISLAAVERVFDPEAFRAANKVEEAQWEGKKVMLLAPWYRDVHPKTAISLLSVFNREKMGFLSTFGDAFIAHARDSLAERFLNSGVEWSFWCDSDVIFPCGNAAWFRSATGFSFPDNFAGLHALNRLLASGKTLVGGVYFGRTATGKPLYAEGMADAAERAMVRKGPRDLVKATRWIATGCLLIHRSVFLDIAHKWPHLHGKWFTTSEHDLVSAAEKSLQLSDAAQIHAQLQRGLSLSSKFSKPGAGEDVVFCHRAAQCGHVPHVDLAVVCGHVGEAVFGPFNTREA